MLCFLPSTINILVDNERCVFCILYITITYIHNKISERFNGGGNDLGYQISFRASDIQFLISRKRFILLKGTQK